MTIITYIKLYQHLRYKDGLKPWEALECIAEVREMAPEILLALKEWADGEEAPDITFNGVSFNKLVNDEGMKPIRAFLMLDWIYREPIAAMNYLASSRLRATIPEPTQDEKKKLEVIVADLKKKNPDLKVKKIPEEEQACSVGEDIIMTEDEQTSTELTAE